MVGQRQIHCDRAFSIDIAQSTDRNGMGHKMHYFKSESLNIADEVQRWTVTPHMPHS